MLGDVIIAMSLIGTGATFADILLSQQQKRLLNRAIESMWYALANIKAQPIVSRARGKWVFLASVAIPFLLWGIALQTIDLNEFVDLITLNDARGLIVLVAIISISPFLWWMSRSNSILGLACKALASIIAALVILDAFLRVGAYMFIDDTDDLIIWGLFGARALHELLLSIFLIAFSLSVIPVPAAYLAICGFAVLEFIFRRCIEHNKGAFLAFCTVIGAAGGLYKYFA